MRGNSKFVKKNSPYIISQTVEIPENFELQVEPGVEIRSSIDTVFLINGKLTVNGTANERVIFAGNPKKYFSTNDAPRLGSEVVINYGVFTGADYLLYRSGNTPFTLKNSEIVNIKNYTYIWYPTGSMSIERNIFRNSGGISLGFDGRVSSKNPAKTISIKNNLFVGKSNTGYWVECWVSYGDVLMVSGNTFFGGPYNAVQIQPSSDSASMDASGNYWGTTNSQEIAAMVLDSSDSIQYKSAITTANPLAAPDANTPSTSTSLVADRYLADTLQKAAEELAKTTEEAKQKAEAERQRAEAEKAIADSASKAQADLARAKEAAAKAEAEAAATKSKKNSQSNEIELDGDLEDPVGDLSATYNGSTQRYSISVSTNLADEALVIRATKKGSKSLQYKITTDEDGESKFSTKNKLKGYTLVLLFNGERLDSFRVK